MKERLVYILKHNLVLQKVYKAVMSLVFRFLGLFVPTDRNLVLFVSFMGTGCGDSPKAIYDAMDADGSLGQYRRVWAVNKPEDYPQYETVKIDTLRYFVTALKAGYWVTNTNIERGLSFKKKDQRCLNTWHGIALKRIGNDCPGRKDFNFASVDHLCVSGDHDEAVFTSAFRAKHESFLRCGMPRNDDLWHCTQEQARQIRQELGLPADKKVILYAPTWRDSADGGKSYAIAPPIHFERWKEALEREYVVLFRAHHLTTKVLNVHFDSFFRDFSEYPDVNRLMMASDILITDYSAIAFDFAILGKPILTFTYDYDSYLAQRGTYFDMDSCYPNPSCRTEEELLQRIPELDPGQEREKTLTFCHRFVRYGGDAARTCVQTLFGQEL